MNDPLLLAFKELLDAIEERLDAHDTLTLELLDSVKALESRVKELEDAAGAKTADPSSQLGPAALLGSA